jgi:hypothetical protein
MKFDKPEHKELTIKIIEAATFPGQLIDLIHELKQAVQNAEIETKES